MTAEAFIRIITLITQAAGAVSAVAAAGALLIKPVRAKIFDLSATRDGLRCVLRAEMLRIFYLHREEKRIRQYEAENFIYAYNAYKKLGGNSFIDQIHKEVIEWEVYTE